MTTVRVAVAQLKSAVGTATLDPRPQNLDRLAAAVARAAAERAQLLVVGEMYLTGLRTDHCLPRYAVDPADPGDPVMRRLRALSREYGVTLIVGTATHGNEVIHNSVVYVEPEGQVQVVHKRHLACIRLPGGQEADEAEFYRPGSAPGLLRTPWGVVGLQICYEVTFPEVARSAMLDGADLIINCTASLSGTEELWGAMAVARAFENSVWFVVASVVGSQAGETYFGGSSIIDASGTVRVQGAVDAADLIVHDIDLDAARRARQEMNVLAARRPELYGNLVTGTVAP